MRAFSLLVPPETSSIWGASGVPVSTLAATGTCTVRLIWLPLAKVLAVSISTVELAKRATSAAPLAPLLAGMVTAGKAVYPAPGWVTVTEVITPPETLAVAVAWVPPAGGAAMVSAMPVPSV